MAIEIKGCKQCQSATDTNRVCQQFANVGLMSLHLQQCQTLPGPIFPVVLPPCLPTGIICRDTAIAASFIHAD